MPGSDVIFSDAAADISHDSLFRKDENLSAQLARLQNTIQVATNPRLAPSHCSTFAIFGRWGIGKSSALGMLRERLMATQKRYGRAKVKARRSITIVDLYAPAYESYGDSAKAIIGLKLLHAVCTDLAPAPEIRSSSYLTDLGSSPFLFDQWTEMLRAKLESSDDGVVAVLLIDELDRCSAPFTLQLMNAVLYWSSRLSSAFFVYAVDQQHLLEAVAPTTHPEAAPRALEKYIQYSVEIPPLLSNRDIRRGFAADLLAQANLSAQRKESLLALLAGEEPLGLLDPLFLIPESETPRGVKRIVARFLGALSSVSELSPNFVKQAVVAALWPDFYRNTVLPSLELRPGTHYELLAGLEGLGRGILAATRDLGLWAGEALVAEGAKQRRINLENIDTLLVLYLGTDPSLVLGEGGVPRGGGAPLIQQQGRIDKLSHDDLEGQLSTLFIRAGAAREQSDRAGAGKYVREGLDLALANRDSMDPAFTSVLSNLALVAETTDHNDLAEQLYDLALSVDPTHGNNIQNYVSFILDEHREAQYGLAERLLDTLERPPLNTHRADRTARLRQQYVIVTGGRGKSLEEGWASRLAADFTSVPKPTMSAFMELLRLFNSADDTTEVRSVSEHMLGAATGPSQRYEVLRGAADLLAGSDDPADENIALDIYRYLLESGLACPPTVSPSSFAAVLNNLATLVDSRGLTRLAGLLLRRAMEAEPRDQAIRRAFANVLLRQGHPEVADEIVSGRTPTQLPDFGTPESLPERHSQGDPWWLVGDLPSDGGCWATVLQPYAKAPQGPKAGAAG